ncbi:MAG: hypothetical protein A2252_11910 [Elusimicrobia bacterium RIFOXYA2_FULL_39_19]|nr:MAG: hypothetical protein A2252_11910 [Elusimicrobia bacterium RIFOXYA2_FULL_39_19]
MLIIGERINSSRKSIFEAIKNKDTAFIQKEAVNQVTAGAHMLDVNCGTNFHDEISDMQWLVTKVQEAVNVPLVIDSPNPKALEAGLKLHKGKPMINSTSGEKYRMDEIMPLVKEFKASVVALAMDEAGMPHTAKERFDVAKKIVDYAGKYGVPPADLYFDCLVRPIATEPGQTKEYLDAVKMVKTIPDVKTTCGLSNISYGLPNRSLINSLFISVAIDAGLDSALIDPTDKNMIAAIMASEALFTKDDYCMNYITWFKEQQNSK